MNSSVYSADRATYLRIVTVALLATGRSDPPIAALELVAAAAAAGNWVAVICSDRPDLSDAWPLSGSRYRFGPVMNAPRRR